MSCARWAFVLVAAAASAQSAPQTTENVASASNELERFRDALANDADAAWERYAAATLGLRREFATLALAASGPEHADGLLAALALEPDAAARAVLAQVLGGLVPLAEPARLERARVLGTCAHTDPAPEVRAAALEALAEAGDAEAAAELDRSIDRLPRAEAAAAARALAGMTAGAPLVRARVLANVAAPARLADGVFAALLPAYGRALAEPGGAPLTPRDRAPILRALRDPSADVRRAGETALAAWLGRLILLREADAADRLLVEFAHEGLEPVVAHQRRASLLLAEGRDAHRVLEAARDVERGAATLGASVGELARAQGRYLEGMALLALDRAEEASRALALAAEGQDARLADRFDLTGEGGAREHEERLHMRAVTELARAVIALSRGRAPGDRSVLEPLRLAHELELEAQALAARGDGREVNHWEAVLRYELAPHTLLFSRPAERWPLARSHDLQRELGRALATVAPGEFPGFAPTEASVELAEPLADPRRERRYVAILDGRLVRVRRELGDLRREVLERDGLEGLQEPDVRQRMRELLFERMEYERWKGDLAEHAPKLRTATRLALSLAGEVSSDGRSAEARALAQALLADLADDERAQVWGEELAAQTEMLVGSTWMQDDRPLEAQAVLESAVRRYESIERTLIERGVGELLLGAVRRERASALMSLAVNSNVRMGEPERALEYFERAYALRQDDFMRVLLACYRARMGRDEEARRVLSEVQIAPPLYYNLACTHALLGDRTRALEYLELDFTTNHDSEGSLEQQKRWAARDPDLVTLRDDPRFEWLIGDATESEEGNRDSRLEGGR